MRVQEVPNSAASRTRSATRRSFERNCDPEQSVIDQWCAQRISQALNHAGHVYVYSPGLSQVALEKSGVTKIENMQETADRLLESHARVVGPIRRGHLQQLISAAANPPATINVFILNMA